jgi:hypothetical protein
MNDGPTPDDFRAKVFRDRVHTEDWRVEKLDDDGGIEVAIFSVRMPGPEQLNTPIGGTEATLRR